MPRKRSFGWIRKLPSGRFQASYIAPTGQRRNAPSTFQTKTDAGEWLTRVQASILDGRWRDPILGRQRFATYADRWIKERPGLRPRTLDLYRWLNERHLRPHLAQLRLDEMTPLVIRRWRSVLIDAGVSDTMIAKSYRLLRAILNTAVDDDIIDRNPCRLRGAGTEKPAERPTLTIRQVQQLCMEVPPRYSAFIAVKTFGSLRWGEITALHRHDLDLDRGILTVRAAYVERSNGSLELGPPKSRASARQIALPEPVVQMLLAHLDAYVRHDPAALVFTGPSGRPLRRSNFNRTIGWERATAAIGVPQLHLHDLRHTGNTLAASTAGTSTRDLMERMGHDTMRAALIYQHASRDADRRIADALSDGINKTFDAADPSAQTARTQHDSIQTRRRRLGVTPRRPGTTDLRVSSDGFAGVVQWQNISFPS